MDHIQFMSEALEEAQSASLLGEVPIGAVVVFEDEVIARASNCRESSLDPLAHAEILALRAAAKHLGRWRLFGCTLYVTLEPCSMCAGATVLSRIERLVYGASDPKAGAAGSLYDIPRDDRLNHRVEVIAGVMRNECSAVLSCFFQSRREEQRKKLKSF